MALENYLLERLVQEANPLIVGQLVGKIQQLSTMEFIIGLRRSDNLSIYFSLLPSRPAFFLTNKLAKVFNKEQAINHLTNFMRKYLTGATLTELVKEPFERRIIIKFSSFDVMGNPLKLSLLLDLMGRSANAHIFVDDVLLASLRELPNNSPVVSLNPLQQREGIVLNTITETNLSEMLKQKSLIEIAKQIKDFSPTLVKEFLAKTEHTYPFQALKTITTQLSEENVPQIYALHKLTELQIGEINLRNNFILSYINLEIAKELVSTKFSSLNQATEIYFNFLISLELFQAQQNALRTKVKAEITKLETLMVKLKVELTEFVEYEKFRSLGELILANLGTLRSEKNKIFLVDYFDSQQPEISLVLPDNQTPKQLAEDYFKRYQRAKRGQQSISKRLVVLEKELTSKRTLLKKILESLTKESLETLEKPILPVVSAKTQVTKKVASKQEALLGGLRRYVSSDNYEVLVGRSDKNNEQLTFQIAKAQDIWLHTSDYPGSHVVIRNPQKLPVPQRTICEAAQLAAYFSKAREETNAAVRYTERKNVSRPKNAKPGMVLLTDFKTIMVKPQEIEARII